MRCAGSLRIVTRKSEAPKKLFEKSLEPVTRQQPREYDINLERRRNYLYLAFLTKAEKV